MMTMWRKRGERIMIGKDIVVTVVSIGARRDNKVRIGVEAPREISVNREEVQRRGPKPTK